MEKSSLRKSILTKRNNIILETKKDYDNQILNTLINTDIYKGAKSIFTYVSFGSEVDTKELIRYSLASGKDIYVPKTDKNNKTMIAVKIHSLDELLVDNYGILEPKVVDEKNIGINFDLIIMPGVAFDKKGNRIGYGGGYYDKYISKCNAQIKKVALAYEIQLVDEIIVEEHDILVDYIITEDKIISI